MLTFPVMADVRKAILAALERKGMSRYQLAMALDDVHPGTVFKFLRGERDASLRVVERMMDVLELEVSPKGQSDPSAGRK